MATPTVAATRATGNGEVEAGSEGSGGRPPVDPSSCPRTQAHHQRTAPRTGRCPGWPTTGATARASPAISAMMPIDATHQMTETSHRIPSGGDASVVAMVCSVLELARGDQPAHQHDDGGRPEAEGVRPPSAGLTVADRGEDDRPPGAVPLPRPARDGAAASVVPDGDPASGRGNLGHRRAATAGMAALLIVRTGPFIAT